MGPPGRTVGLQIGPFSCRCAGLVLAAALTACGAVGPTAPAPLSPQGVSQPSAAAAAEPLALGPGEHLWRLLPGQPAKPITPEELLTAMAAADAVLLGELHDQPLHAVRRGEAVLALSHRLGHPVAVVIEHAERGRSVAAGQTGAALLGALTEAGFAAEAWGWPLQRPLFEPLLATGHGLIGGNLPRATAREVARSGPSAWPADLQPLLTAAPLEPLARERLDAQLLASHCGHLRPERVPAMRAAQRARDAAMAQAMMQSLRNGAGPVVLLAGNGHVREDFGVPQLLAAQTPAPRILSIAFTESDSDAAPAVAEAQRPGLSGGDVASWTGVVWSVPTMARPDPCETMRGLPRPVPRQPAPLNR